MGKRIGLLVVIMVLILSAGCELFPQTATQEIPSALSDAELATLSALATQVNKTPEAIPQLPTETPGAQSEGQGGLIPTNTPLPGSIAITNIVVKSYSSALVTWEVNGDFPSGFKVLWTDQEGNPTYPASNSVSAGSSTARSAIINLTPGSIYFIRVCRFLFDACDIYSDLYIYAFLPPTPSPTADPARTATAAAKRLTATAASAGTGGTVVAYDTTLAITMIKGGENGKAYMTWTDKSPNSIGYRIMYSTTSTTPTFGTDPSYVVYDTTARAAYVDGNSGAKYYYRICRATATGCATYSAAYTFTYPTYTVTVTPDTTAIITITGVKDNAVAGKIDLTWTATGTITNGFKMLYSTDTTPTISNSTAVPISDNAAVSGTITASENSKYYLRICRFNGSTCDVYSNIVEFTTKKTGIVLSNAGDPIVYTWVLDPDVDNPDGYYIFWGAGTLTPVWATTLTAQQAALAADRTITLVLGTPLTAGKYIFRLCTVTGTTCTSYSNTLEIIVP